MWIEKLRFGDLIDRAADRWPEREALWFEGRRWTFGEQRAEVDRAAKALIAAGVGHGDHVCLWLGNRPEFVFLFFAVAKIGAIAERHPRLRVIVDHMGLNVQWKGKDLAPGIDQLLKFARLENVGVKVSCLPCYVDEPYPYPTLHPQIRRVVDAFGPQRIFWGTDLSQSPCSYRQNITLFTEALDFLSASDKEWIMGKALAQWLRWNL
jgi:predicted TIM-barrel fold metal-dependent hydrolase